ncbi:MAG: hypothetical protein NZM13_07660 [Cyclobacteriaceae bacterium]|nr:hypothetical protein [Cyclobacteriaceae bacterium]
MRNFCLILLALCADLIYLSAQTGTYLLTHYQPEGEAAGLSAYDIAQADNGLMYFAVSRGVLRFDGKSWELFRTGGAVYDLLINDQVLYTAGPRGAGKMDIRNTINPSYVHLSSPKTMEPVFQMAAASGKVVFISERNIYALQADSVIGIAQTPSEWISALAFGDRIYVSTADDNTFVVQNNQLIAPSLAEIKQHAWVFAETLGNFTLLGSPDNQLYLLEGNKYLRQIRLVDSDYAEASVILSGCWVTPDLVALGTLRGGVLFVNPHTGKTEQIINYMAGLPDNEILAITTDKSKNVWVAHRNGFTRIAPFLPFRSFAHYPGLQGDPLCAERFNGNVYAGTSLGLFQLTRQDRYDEIVYYVDVPVTTRVNKMEDTGKSRNEDLQQEKQRSGLFGFLRKRKPVVVIQEPIAQVKEEVIISYRREKRTRRILRSSEYTFRKVSGIDARITQLLVWNGKLLASGLAGIWEVENEKAKIILDEPVRNVVTHPESNNLYAVSYEGKVHLLPPAGAPKTRIVGDTLLNTVQYAFAGRNESVWLCAADKVYRLLKDKGLEVFPIDNPDYDPVYGVVHKNHVVFLASGKAWIADEHSLNLIPIDSLSGYSQVLPDGQSLWLRTARGWRVLGRSFSEEAVSLLAIIPDITNIHADQSTNTLWISTRTGDLIAFKRDAILPVAVRYPLLLKSVRINGQPADVSRGSIRLTGEKNAFHIQVMMPDYNSPDLIQYRYRLSGIKNDWSDWSPGHAMLDFPFLAEGKYQLEIQAQTANGHVSEPVSISIHVLPPYWNRWWFYAIEFGVFSLLIISSFRLSSRYRFVSRILSLLSIIILIEFIQTVAGTTFALEGGPVIEFLVQVAIAFIILPVEGFLRNVMLRSLENNKNR